MHRPVVIGLVLAIAACRRAEPPPPADELRPTAPARGTAGELHARALIEALLRGDPEPLAALITDATTWDGVTRTGGKAANVTRREDIRAAGDAARELVGDFRQVAFVWTEGDYVYLVTEHARGDFVFMVKLDAEQKLAHLTFTPPDYLPRAGCSAGASRLLDDASIFTGPTGDEVPTVAIVGSLGGTGLGRLHDLAAGLSCKGIASILVPDQRPLATVPAGVRLVVAHARDRALIPAGVEQLVLDEVLPAMNRQSGPSVIASYHVAQAVIDEIAARVSQRK